MTSHYEKKAEEYAARVSKTHDVTNDVYKQSLKQFNDSIDKEKVYLNYTYNQVRQMEIGLGLDLKGRHERRARDFSPRHPQAVCLGSGTAQPDQRRHRQGGGRRREVVRQGLHLAFRFLHPAGERWQAFSTAKVSIWAKIKSNSSNTEVTAALQEQVNSQVDAAFNIFRTRIDQFGVVAPNIQKLQDKNGQILLELPGVKEPERVTELLKSSANLEFFEVYNYNEIKNDLNAFAMAYAAQDTVNKLNLVELLGGPQRDGSPRSASLRLPTA